MNFSNRKMHLPMASRAPGLTIGLKKAERPAPSPQSSAAEGQCSLDKDERSASGEGHGR
jgi:hypothetical protein